MQCIGWVQDCSEYKQWSMRGNTENRELQQIGEWKHSTVPPNNTEYHPFVDVFLGYKTLKMLCSHLCTGMAGHRYQWGNLHAQLSPLLTQMTLITPLWPPFSRVSSRVEDQMHQRQSKGSDILAGCRLGWGIVEVPPVTYRPLSSILPCLSFIHHHHIQRYARHLSSWLSVLTQGHNLQWWRTSFAPP